MDGTRLDSLSRTLAQGSTRRQAIRRGGALAALGAALGFGSTRSIAAQSSDLTCTWDFQGTNVTGAGAGSSFSAELTLSLDDDGAIDDGELTISGSTPFDVVGQATGRALNLWVEVQNGGVVTLAGTGKSDILDCSGEVRGSFSGPEPDTLGTWIATATGSSGQSGGGGATGNSSGTRNTGSSQGRSTSNSSGSASSGSSNSSSSGSSSNNASGSSSSGGFGAGDDSADFSEAPTCDSGQVLCNNQCVSADCSFGEEINQNTCECGPPAQIPGQGGDDGGFGDSTCSEVEVFCGGQCIPAFCDDGLDINPNTCTCEPPAQIPGQDDGGGDGGGGGGGCADGTIDCGGQCVPLCAEGQELSSETCTCMSPTGPGN